MSYNRFLQNQTKPITENGYVHNLTVQNNLIVQGSTIISGADLIVDGNVLPFVTNTYNIGSLTEQWKDGYFSNQILTPNINNNGNQILFDAELDITGDIIPQNNNAQDLGSLALRFQTGYFGSSILTPVIENNGSDININENIILNGDCNPGTNDTYSFGFSTNRFASMATTSIIIWDGVINTDEGPNTRRYNLPNPHSAAPTTTILTIGDTATITATKTFSIAIPVTPTTNQLVLGTTNTATLNFPSASLSAPRIFSLPSGTDTNCNFVMSSNSGTQNITSSIAITGNISATNLSGTNTGDVTLTAVGSSPNANGASLSGQALTLQPANGSSPGLVSTTTQTFVGDKTFGNSIIVNAQIRNTLTNGNNIVLGNTNTATLSCVTSSLTSTRTYTIPSNDVDCNFIMSTGTQTIGGSKSFSSAINITPTTNQIVTGTSTNLTTSNYPASSGAVTLTFPNVTTTIATTDTSQTFTNKTITSPVWSGTWTGNILTTNGSVSATTILETKITTDTNNRWGFDNIGELAWGSGSAAYDIFMARSGANTLSITDNTLTATTGILNVGTIVSKNTTDSSSVTTGSLQTAGGLGVAKKIFAADTINCTKTTNQFILGTTNTITISASAPASSYTLTLPDPGGSVNWGVYTSNTSTTITFSGIWASSQNVTCSFYKMNNIVTMILHSTVTATSNSASQITFTVPAGFRPVTADNWVSCQTIDNAVVKSSQLRIVTGGTGTFFLNNQAAYTSGATCGMQAGVITWTSI